MLKHTGQGSISSQGGSRSATCGQIVFGGIFFSVGSGIFIALGLLSFLEKGFAPEVFAGGVGLIFAIVGAAIILQAIRGRGQAKKLPSAPTAFSMRNSGMVELKPGQKPLATLLFSVFFALFWNGITWTFVVMMFATKEHMPIFPLLFMIPFVLVGLALIGFVIHSLLALFNPSPHLRLNPGALPLGATAELEWTIIGAVERIAKFTLELRGQEVARYQRGTDTVTVTSVFEKITLFEGAAPNEIRTGRVQIAFPEFTMHTFDAPNNKIQWLIMVKGEVPRWPDINLEFPVTVLPLPLTPAP